MDAECSSGWFVFMHTKTSLGRSYLIPTWRAVCGDMSAAIERLHAVRLINQPPSGEGISAGDVLRSSALSGKRLTRLITEITIVLPWQALHTWGVSSNAQYYIDYRRAIGPLQVLRVWYSALCHTSLATEHPGSFLLITPPNDSLSLLPGERAT